MNKPILLTVALLASLPLISTPRPTEKYVPWSCPPEAAVGRVERPGAPPLKFAPPTCKASLAAPHYPAYVLRSLGRKPDPAGQQKASANMQAYLKRRKSSYTEKTQGPEKRRKTPGRAMQPPSQVIPSAQFLRAFIALGESVSST